MTAASFLTAVERLADVLARENAALAALDLAAVTRCLPEKTAALQALAPARADEAASTAARAAVARARALMAENRTLLERAMMVQNRIIGLIAGAMREAAGGRGYRSDGQRASGGSATAYALSARA
jgi:hypothetical protein